MVLLANAPELRAGTISFNLRSASVIAGGDGTAVFEGTVTNNSGQTLNASDFFFNFFGFDASIVTPTQDLGLTSDPHIPNGTTSSLLDLFRVLLNGASAGSIYTVNAQLEDVNSDLSADQFVTVSMSTGPGTVVPEPVTLGYSCLVLILIGALALRSGLSRTERTGILLLLALSLAPGRPGCAQAATGPILSTQAPMAGMASGAYFIVLPILNSGTADATNIQVNSVTLHGVAATGPALPIALGTISPGAVETVDLHFDPSGLTAGQKYLLTLRGTYEANGTALGFALNYILLFGAPSIFELPPDPLSVTPALDSVHSITQGISAANGGTVTTTGADGSAFSLTIPPNSLASDERITMTPVTGMDGIPAGGTFVAGVEMQPDGLRFLQPATLSIQPPVAVSAEKAVGYGYHGSGQNFHLEPLFPDSALTLQINHFSGVGILENDIRLQIVNQMFAAEDRLSNAIAGKLNCPIICTQVQDILQQYYEQVLNPLLDKAVSDDAAVPEMVGASVAWLEFVKANNLLQSEPFKTEVASVGTRFLDAIVNLFNQSFVKCSQDQADAARMVDLSGMLYSIEALLKGSNSAGSLSLLLPDYAVKIADCNVGAVQVDFDSHIAGTLTTGPLVIAATAHFQENGLELRFDPTTLRYSGSGPLNYLSFSYGQSLPGLGDCSTYSTNSGILNGLGSFDLNVLANLDHPVLHLDLIAQISENLAAGFIYPGTGCSKGPPTLTPWGSYFLGTSLYSPTPVSPLFVPVSTTQKFSVSGTAKTSSQAAVGFSDSTVTLTQVSKQ